MKKNATQPALLQFHSDIFDIPRRKKLAFFDVDDAPACPCCEDEVGLAAKKSGNLDDINIFRGNLDLLRRMNIRRYRHAHLSTDLSQELATLADARSAKGMN